MGEEDGSHLTMWGSRGRGYHFIGRAEKSGGMTDSRAPPTRAF